MSCGQTSDPPPRSGPIDLSSFRFNPNASRNSRAVRSKSAVTPASPIPATYSRVWLVISLGTLWFGRKPGSSLTGVRP